MPYNTSTGAELQIQSSSRPQPVCMILSGQPEYNIFKRKVEQQSGIIFGTSENNVSLSVPACAM